MAKRLGKENVDEMLRNMSAIQWMEWKIMMALEPSIEDRIDYHAAIITQAIWNVQIAKATKPGHRPKFRELHEFILRFGDSPDVRPKPTRNQTSRERGLALRAIFGHKEK